MSTPTATTTIPPSLTEQVKALAKRILLDQAEHPQIRARAIELLLDCGDLDEELSLLIELARKGG